MSGEGEPDDLSLRLDMQMCGWLDSAAGVAVAWLLPAGGTVPGVLLGCLLLGTINVALAVLGIDETWQKLVYGLVILIALILDSRVKKWLGKLSEVGS